MTTEKANVSGLTIKSVESGNLKNLVAIMKIIREKGNRDGVFGTW